MELARDDIRYATWVIASDRALTGSPSVGFAPHDQTPTEYHPAEWSNLDTNHGYSRVGRYQELRRLLGLADHYTGTLHERPVRLLLAGPEAEPDEGVTPVRVPVTSVSRIRLAGNPEKVTVYGGWVEIV